MWLFRKPTIEETKNKAFVRYISRCSIGDLENKFPKIERWRIKLWVKEFNKIINEVEIIVDERERFDYENLIKHLAVSYPFLNKKSLDKAGWLGSYYAWRQGYKRKYR